MELGEEGDYMTMCRKVCMKRGHSRSEKSMK